MQNNIVFYYLIRLICTIPRVRYNVLCAAYRRSQRSLLYSPRVCVLVCVSPPFVVNYGLIPTTTIQILLVRYELSERIYLLYVPDDGGRHVIRLRIGGGEGATRKMAKNKNWK